MSGRIDEFLEIQNQKNRVALSVFNRLSALGYGDDFLDVYQDSAVIEQIILELHPTSIRSITTICSLVSAYAKLTGIYYGKRQNLLQHKSIFLMNYI